MQETIENFLKRTPIVWLVLGISLVLISASEIITVGSDSIKFNDSQRIILTIIGIVLILLGISYEIYERLSIKRTPSGDGQVRVFNNRKDYTDYRTKQLQKAKKVDDATWRFHGLSKQTYSGEENIANLNELEVISHILKKPETIWREVAIFTSSAQLERESSLITDPENCGYNFAIFEVDPQTSPPLTGFMIIDDKMLFIGYPLKNIRLVIDNPLVVKLFS